MLLKLIIGRGERIRTSGPCLPKTVLYQAELLPDRSASWSPSAEAGARYNQGICTLQAWNTADQGGGVDTNWDQF